MLCDIFFFVICVALFDVTRLCNDVALVSHFWKYHMCATWL